MNRVVSRPKGRNRTLSTAAATRNRSRLGRFARPTAPPPPHLKRHPISRQLTFLRWDGLAHRLRPKNSVPDRFQNGISRATFASAVRETPKADPNQVAAPLPGLVVGVAVNVGDAVRKGQKLLSIEAMKMETTLYAERPGRVAEVITAVGRQVKTGELLVRLAGE